ncbi:MAG: methyltransferase domain-containing protein [Bacteroidota bacterium]
MTINSTNPTDYRYKSKNSRYLAPKHKELAKRAFEQERRIQKYYAFQSKIYDATRWSFLFGRKAILQQFPYTSKDNFSLLEVGCGTGYNLRNIAQTYPNARLMGVDVSKKMIELTNKKMAKQKLSVQLLNIPYTDATQRELKNRPQIILFSYALTMINPHWMDLILQAKKDLTAIGYIAVVDFHHSPFTWFRKHMQSHHVRMEGHILPFLRDNFEPLYDSVDKAYGGLWEYFTFVGKLVD